MLRKLFALFLVILFAYPSYGQQNVLLGRVITFLDNDGDGFGNPHKNKGVWWFAVPIHYVKNGRDCNDSSASVYPGAPELCNGIDDNCDGEIDNGITFTLYYADEDGDGYGVTSGIIDTCLANPPPGYVENDDDCNDESAAINPGSREVCNGIDDDCNFHIDEGFTPFRYYIDEDGDSYGFAFTFIDTCAETPPTGYVTDNTDCDDGDSDINPGENETCDNLIDDDCDGDIDEGCGSNLTPEFTYTKNGFYTYFTDLTTSDDPITSWLWEFNDGGNTTGRYIDTIFSVVDKTSSTYASAEGPALPFDKYVGHGDTETERPCIIYLHGSGIAINADNVTTWVRDERPAYAESTATAHLSSAL